MTKLQQQATSQTLQGMPGMFDIVYADPPWPMYGDPNKNAAAG